MYQNESCATRSATTRHDRCLDEAYQSCLAMYEPLILTAHGLQPNEMHPVTSLVRLSLDVVVCVGSATQEEADEDAAAADQEQTQQDVD